MSSEELIYGGELNDDAYSLSSKVYTKQKEEQQGIRVVTQSEQSWNPKGIKNGYDDVERLRPSQQLSAKSAEIDLPAVQEYISQLPEELVPEFALLLAQRMKRQIRMSDKFSQEAIARAQADSITDGRTKTKEHAAHLLGRIGRSDSITAVRYIVTTHPSHPGTSIQHRLGEPELISCIPPGLYREDIDGTMVRESSFRSSMVELKEEPEDSQSTNNFPTKQGRLRKMMSKVFKKQTRQ